MKRSVQLVAALLLSLTLGLHWAVLQSVAWTSMLIERTQNGSFVEAIQTTFDGQHPCKLCQVVREGKSVEKVPSSLTKLPKVEISTPETVAIWVCPPQVEPVLRRAMPVPASRLDPPALPPPRLA